MATSDAGVEALLVADDSSSYDYGDSDGGGATQPTSLGSKFINKKGRILNGVLAGKGGRSSKEQNSEKNANHPRRYERDALADMRDIITRDEIKKNAQKVQKAKEREKLEAEARDRGEDISPSKGRKKKNKAGHA